MEHGWTAPIDAYCERTDPGFWAEPLNALTNLAFLIAAAAALHRWRGSAPGDWPALALIGVLTAIGIGSFLFHTFANRWSLLADVIPITVFIYVYFFFAMRRYFGMGAVAALAVTAAFLAGSFGFGAVLPRGFLSGSGGYLPALFAILAVGGLLVARRSPFGPAVLLAGGILTVSLTARTLDPTLCGALTVGTHFLWHILNAVTLYILLDVLMRAGPSWVPEGGMFRSDS